MKRILALLISLMMVFALVACNNTENPDNGGGGTGGGGGSGGGGGGDPSSIVNDPDYNPNDPEQYIYKAVFANSPYKAQWDSNAYGANVNDVWDSSVLPSVVPTKPSSVTEVETTGFVGLLDKKLGYSSPGKLYIEADYESQVQPWTYYYVDFKGTQDTFNTLCQDFAEAFECYDDREDWDSSEKIRGTYHAYSTEWYCYMSYSQQGSYDTDTWAFIPDESGEWLFSIYVIPVHHELPKQVEGLTLPTFGYLMNGVFELIGYSDGDDDYTYTEYNFATGTASGALKDNWSTSDIQYYGATLANAESYAQYLVSQGYEKTYDSRDYDATTYTLTYEKGDISVDIRYYADQKYMELWVTCGDTGLFFY